MTQDTQQQRPKGRVRRVLKWAGIAVFALVLAVAASGYWLLRTDSGRARLAAVIERTAARQGVGLSLEGLGGALPGEIICGSVAVADGQGTWLAVRDLEVRLHVAALLDGLWHLERIAASSVNLARLPRAEPGLPDAGPGGGEAGIFKPPRVLIQSLELERVDIAEAAFGKAAVLGISSTIESTGDAYVASATARRVDGSPDSLEFSGTMPIDLSALTINLTLDEEPGGLVGAMIGLPGQSGLSVELSGSGPLRDWTGSLNAQAPGTGAIQAEYRVTGQDALTLVSTGKLTSELTVVNDAFWRLIGRQADYNLTVTREPGGRITSPLVDFASSGLDFKVENAAVDPDTRQVQGQVSGRVVNHQALADLAHMRALQVDDLRLDVTGTLDAMQVSLEAAVGDTAIAGVRAVDSKLTARGVVERAFSGGAPGVRLQGGLTSPSIDLPYNEVVLKNVDIQFDADTGAFRTLNVPRLDVTADGADVKVSAVMALNATSLDADVDAMFSEAGPLLPYLGGISAQTVQFTGRMTSSPRDVRFDVEGQGALTGVTGLPEIAADLAQGRVGFAGQVVLADRIIRTPGLDVASDRASLDLEGGLDPWQRTFDAHWSLAVDDPEWIRETLGLGLAGRPTVSGKASGSFTDFDIEIKAVTDGILFGGLRLDGVEVLSKARGLPGNRAARVDASALWRGRPVTLGFDAVDRGGGLGIEEVALAAPHLRAGGDVTLLLESGLARGKITARVDRLSEYADVLGDASGAANLEAELLDEGATQGLALRADLFEAGFGRARSRKTEAGVRVRDLLGEPTFKARASVSGAELGPALVEYAQFHADGDPGSAQGRLSAHGGAGKPFSLEARLGLTRQGETLELAILSFSGAFAGLEAKARQAAMLSAGPDGLYLDDLALAVGQGAITGSGFLGEERAYARAAVDGVDLMVLEPFFPVPFAGNLQAGLAVDGTPRDPAAEITVNLTGLRSKRAEDSASGRITARAVLQGGEAELSADLVSVANQRLSLAARAPVSFSLAPPELLATSGGISGTAQGVLDLAALQGLFELEDHYAAGRVPVDIRLAGALDAPEVRGELRLDEVRYEYLPLGSVLRDVTGVIKLSGHVLELHDFKGLDAGDGRVEASGQVQVQPGRGLSYDLRLAARRAALMHTRLIEASVDGDFSLQGDLDSGSLAGTMTVDPARVRLPEQTPPEIVDLEVVRVGESSRNSSPGKTSPPYALELDVGISIPARFFVSGRGLDAEFAGRLDVSGMAAAPDITGTMNVVRGSYEFLDRRLDLEQGGLNFTGQGATPFLDVTAVSRGPEVDAKVRLTGPADDFSLELTSDPPLPDNEIMARLLFGRRAADLNPVQALQLANALASLAGGRGGGGVLAEARRSLGLDQLVISGGEAGSAPAVGVGKYVRENVYLEVERDFTTGGEEVRVEVDLSPRTGVSGSASQYSGSEVGVHWKMNY